MRFDVPGYSFLIGEFNLYNILASVSVARILQISPESIQASLKNIYNIQGRMERVTGGIEAIVVIDFAHTPNALERTLETARTMTDGRVIAVYGSAGERCMAISVAVPVGEKTATAPPRAGPPGSFSLCCSQFIYWELI